MNVFEQIVKKNENLSSQRRKMIEKVERQEHQILISIKQRKINDFVKRIKVNGMENTDLKTPASQIVAKSTKKRCDLMICNIPSKPQFESFILSKSKQTEFKIQSMSSLNSKLCQQCLLLHL